MTSELLRCQIRKQKKIFQICEFLRLPPPSQKGLWSPQAKEKKGKGKSKMMISNKSSPVSIIRITLRSLAPAGELETKGSLQHPDSYPISLIEGVCGEGMFQRTVRINPKEHLESYLTLSHTPVCPAPVYAVPTFSCGKNKKSKKTWFPLRHSESLSKIVSQKNKEKEKAVKN